MRAIKYLKMAKRNKQMVLDDLENMLPEHVSKVDLIPVVRNRLLKSFMVRTLLTANADEDDVNMSLRSLDIHLGKAGKGAVPGAGSTRKYQ